MNKRQWVVYMIRCSDESLYCGITNNLKKRLAMHNLGRGAKYTRSRWPVELVGFSSEMTKSDALKLEYQVKQVPAWLTPILAYSASGVNSSLALCMMASSPRALNFRHQGAMALRHLGNRFLGALVPGCPGALFSIALQSYERSQVTRKVAIPEIVLV